MAFPFLEAVSTAEGVGNLTDGREMRRLGREDAAAELVESEQFVDNSCLDSSEHFFGEVHLMTAKSL